MSFDSLAGNALLAHRLLCRPAPRRRRRLRARPLRLRPPQARQPRGARPDPPLLEGGAACPAARATPPPTSASLGGVPVPVGARRRRRGGRGRSSECWRSAGSRPEGFWRSPGYGTPTKTRILAGAPHAIKQQVVRYDREARLAPDPAVAGEIAEAPGGRGPAGAGRRSLRLRLRRRPGRCRRSPRERAPRGDAGSRRLAPRTAAVRGRRRGHSQRGGARGVDRTAARRLGRGARERRRARWPGRSVARPARHARLARHGALPGRRGARLDPGPRHRPGRRRHRRGRHGARDVFAGARFAARRRSRRRCSPTSPAASSS